MCLILFSFKKTPGYPLIVAANRDEFYKRKTSTLDIWKENSAIVAGKDLESEGTWMGVNRLDFKFAAITNYRDPSINKTDAKSRGLIVSSFLENDISGKEFINKLRKEKDLYNGFNLIFGTPLKLFHYSNINDVLTDIPPGIHGLSNRFLNTAWPKVEKGKELLSKALNSDTIAESCLEFLQNDCIFPDESLPDTGMGKEWERLLSPIFIKSEIYGTRSSSVLLFDKSHKIEFTEKAWIKDGVIKKTVMEFFPG